MARPIMAKATAVWLVDNTTISFKQIADFVEMHELEVQGIADGDVAAGVKGFDPITNNQLTLDEIDAAQGDIMHRIKLKFNAQPQAKKNVVVHVTLHCPNVRIALRPSIGWLSSTQN